MTEKTEYALSKDRICVESCFQYLIVGIIGIIVLFLPFGGVYASDGSEVLGTFFSEIYSIMTDFILVGTVLAILAVAVCLLFSISANDEKDKQKMKQYIIKILMYWVMLLLITQIFSWIMGILGFNSTSDIADNIGTGMFTTSSNDDALSGLGSEFGYASTTGAGTSSGSSSSSSGSSSSISGSSSSTSGSYSASLTTPDTSKYEGMGTWETIGEGFKDSISTFGSGVYDLSAAITGTMEPGYDWSQFGDNLYNAFMKTISGAGGVLGSVLDAGDAAIEFSFLGDLWKDFKNSEFVSTLGDWSENFLRWSGITMPK